MDKINQNKYETPTIEVVEIQVEQGFATSSEYGEAGQAGRSFGGGDIWDF